MHCRRNFFEVARSTRSKGLADTAVKMIGKLYGIEEEMKDKSFSFEQCYEYRQQYSKPLLEQFKVFLDENIKKVLPKLPLGKAFSYAINQWSKLTRYIEDGRLEIDNGLSERKIKPFVIGRNYAEFNIMLI
jgi:transposase